MTLAPRSVTHVMQLATSDVVPGPSGPLRALQIDSGELNATPVTPRPLFALPVIVPATCVPWPLSSRHAPAHDDAAGGLAAVDRLADEVLVGLRDAGVHDADLHPAGRREGAHAGEVPALGRVDVGVGCAARLAGVVEAVELAEPRVVRRREDLHRRVDLGVLDAGAWRSASRRGPPGRRPS